jgi:branched-chain amino acid transport system ATP-binding protein
MVAIGVGLMGDPVLLLLDEPTLGLAPKVKEELREKIAAVRAEGLVLVLVDGDIDFVLSLTDRWYAVDQGRVVHEGDSDVELGVEQLATMYFGGPA